MTSKPKANRAPTTDEKEKTAAIVTVGNELLSGLVENRNASWLARELLDCGISLKLVLTLPDDVPAISEALSDLAASHSYVFVTGGVGPTPDDVTREAVAKALGRPLIEHPTMAELLRGFYGKAFSERVLVMAQLPHGAELISEDGQSFPGFRIENIYVFPGIPEFMQENFAFVKHALKGTPFHSKSLTTFLDESKYADLLEKAIGSFPEVLFGSYPHLRDGGFTATVVARSRDTDILDKAWGWLMERWPE